MLENVGICRCGETFESSRWKRGWIFPEIFLLQQPNFRFVWIALWPCVAFLLLSSLTQSSKFTLSWTDEPQSPAPQKPAEAIPWWASGGQLSSYCGCCLCQLNTVTFDLSFFPLCLSISASCWALWTLEKKEAPSRLAWPQLCQKKNKRGKIFYSEMNSQPFTVKKYFVCWVVV